MRMFSSLPPDMQTFARSYRYAAKALVRSIPEGQNNKGDVGCVPIIFLYRHALELYMKEILLTDGMPASTVLEERRHFLDRQVSDVARVAKKLGVRLSKSTVDFINRAHISDPEGMLTRYPVTKKGEWSELQNLVRFELKSFVEEAEGAVEELDGILQEIQDGVYRETERKILNGEL